MYKYLHMQEAPITDNITDDGHVGSKLPWPVVADKDGTITVPSSRLGLRRVVGFQKDLARMEIDVRWKEAFAYPDKTVGMYMVTLDSAGGLGVSRTPVDSAEMLEHADPLPLD